MREDTRPKNSIIMKAHAFSFNSIYAIEVFNFPHSFKSHFSRARSTTPYSVLLSRTTHIPVDFTRAGCPLL